MKAFINSIALALTSLVFTVLAPIAVVEAAPSSSATKGAIQTGVNDASGGSGSQNAASNLNTTIGNIINVLSAIVGVAALVMIILGGFRYVTSGGDSTKVTGAKNTVLYAVIGLIIVAFAQIIVHFVLNKSKVK